MGRGGGAGRGATSRVTTYNTRIYNETIYRLGNRAEVPSGLAAIAKDVPGRLAVIYNPTAGEWHVADDPMTVHANFFKEASGATRLAEADKTVVRGMWIPEQNLLRLYDARSQARYLEGGHRPFEERRIAAGMERAMGAARYNVFMLGGNRPDIETRDIAEALAARR